MHLSDLHFGKLLLEQSLIEDQKYIVDEIIDIVKNKKVELVMIAGDIYDKSIPNVEAVNLFSSFLSKLYKLGVKVLVISGNHDSKDRLSFGNELFIDNGVYIEGIFNGSLRKEVFEDRYGKINFYMLPFVKPVDVRMYYPDIDIKSYNDAVKCIIDNTLIEKNERNIIMLHQFVTGMDIDIERSDSETISLGGLDNIDVNLFNDFDYVALGHIHGPQKIGRDTVRYAGSPLKYSFSEVNQVKSIPIIDINEKGNIDIELVKLDFLRDVRVIRGPIDKLLSEEISSMGNKDDYIDAIITDNDYVIDAISKLRRVYPNILKVEYDNKRVNGGNEVEFEISNNKKSPIEYFSEFYKMQNNVNISDDRLKILDSVLKEVEDETN